MLRHDPIGSTADFLTNHNSETVITNQITQSVDTKDNNLLIFTLPLYLYFCCWDKQCPIRDKVAVVKIAAMKI